MELCLTSSTLFRSPELPLLRRKSDTPTIVLRRTRLTISAKKRTVIEGVSDEMNAIASQNLDFAPARRRVRSAFKDAQQQLDHCLFKMAPSGIREDEWYERNSKGLEIFCKSWLPKPGVRIKGALCFCHGYGDTCTFFFEGIAKHIAASGYGVYAIDHPGFGLSEGLHGYIPSFDDIVDNVIEQYTLIKGRPEVRGLPRFILGQSMGGAVALKVHLKEPREWDGVVLVAPMCKISEDVTPPEAVVKIIRLFSKVMPKAKLVPQKDLAELAFRELTKRKMAPYNVICYNHPMRLKTAVELLNTTKHIESHVEKVSSPLLILHGASDKLTDPLVSQFLYEKASSKDKTLKIYEQGFHCILEGEPDDRIFTVLNDIIAWLDSRCSIK
ncbi:Caffeoylshikimate esterase [Camellia lanceoleosa]|uniref:Caffeoylshikimate esterase n=1 Tax=Camellia lanceoleosa TaxID=1840588 RepID=A0ACC0GAW8_9ERIC|nr:Caffeoylshikimate esterase [Camellia lanceoleosa]